LPPDPVSPRLVDGPVPRSVFSDLKIGSSRQPSRRQIHVKRSEIEAPLPVSPRLAPAPRPVFASSVVPLPVSPRLAPRREIFASEDTLRKVQLRLEGLSALPEPNILFPANLVQVIYYYVYNSSERETPIPRIDHLNDDLGVLEYMQYNKNYIDSLRDIPLPKIDIPHQAERNFKTAELPTPRKLYYFRSIGNRYDFTRNVKLKAFINAVVNTGPEEDVWTSLLYPPRGFEGSQVLYGTKTSGHPLSRLWDGDVSRSLYITKKLRGFAGRLIIKISKAE